MYMRPKKHVGLDDRYTDVEPEKPLVDEARRGERY